MAFSRLQPPAIFESPAPMSQGTVAQGRRLVFIAGQVAQDERGNTVGVGDVERQTQKVLENIRTLVEAAGGSLADVARFCIFLTDRAHLPTVMAVRRRMLSEPYPATTAVVVSGLANPEWLVEIEATAVLS